MDIRKCCRKGFSWTDKRNKEKMSYGKGTAEKARIKEKKQIKGQRFWKTGKSLA